MRRSGMVALLVSAAACNNELPKPEQVTNLRIAAIQAEPPDGAPGETVTLRALVLQPAPADYDQAWIACIPGAAESDATPLACARPMDMASLPACGAAPPAGACLLGLGATAPLTLPAATSAAQVYVSLVAAERSGGGLTGCATALAAGDPADFCRVALKRVAIRAPGAAANHNPRIADLTFTGDGATVTLAPGSPEPGEQLFLSWYVTAGEVPAFHTDGDTAGLSSAWTPPGVAGTMAVVVRDDRGGEGWIVKIR